MTSLYIHIPFCKRKCNYCDFVSYADKESLMDDYVEALLNEIHSSPLLFPSPQSGEGTDTTRKVDPPLHAVERGGTNPPRRMSDGVRTIYFGGGTPTLLSPQHFENIISTIIRNSSLVISNSEITIEANPGTVNKTYLKELKQLGINRISLGAQTFNDAHLKTLGRIHSSKQIYQAVEDARPAGFDNINLDLIFALPDQTLDELKEDIKQALSLQTEHLSTYNLQIEEGTPLFSTGFKVNEELDAAMFEYTIETLTANGYGHYEISNFAKPGKECRHNVNYWKNGNYIGIGAGAHSHVNGKRWANTDSLGDYIRSFIVVDARMEARKSIVDSRKTSIDTSIEADKRDSLFMGLRLLAGLSVDSFTGFEAELSDLIDQGLLEQKNGLVKLSKRGLFMANLVFERFV